MDLAHCKMCVNVLAQIDVDLVYYKLCAKMCWLLPRLTLTWSITKCVLRCFGPD